MNKNIFTLLLAVFVLVSMSAVSATDLDDNNATPTLDDGSDIVAVSNGSSNVLGISENQDIQLVPDSENDVFGITPTLTFKNWQSEINVGQESKIKCQLYGSGQPLGDQVVYLYINNESTASATTDQELGECSFKLSFNTPGTYTVKCVFEGNTQSGYGPCESETRSIDVKKIWEKVFLENTDIGC